MFAHNKYYTNIKGPKKMWVPMVEKLGYDDDTDNFSSSYTHEEINMLYYSNHTMEEKYFHNDNKTKSLNILVLVRSVIYPLVVLTSYGFVPQVT